MSGLEIRDLRKSFTSGDISLEVLRGVDLTLAPGDAAAIMGPSGSGKSTLLHLIGALDRPSSGSLRIDGQDPLELDEQALARFRNRVAGFVFQEHHLLPQYTVLENVLLPTLAFPEKGRDSESWARELLDRVGLTDRVAHLPAELSGGERQRAAVARALIQKPSLLLCDEPTGNLDRVNAESVVDLLFELHREEQNILIAVTHSLAVGERFPRRFELLDGRCVAV
jgi:lipoprotein-releasing system ATP-binding protein